jgi:pimeloyl-ACP methyl ester carboxylesterase
MFEWRQPILYYRCLVNVPNRFAVRCVLVLLLGASPLWAGGAAPGGKPKTPAASPFGSATSVEAQPEVRRVSTGPTEELRVTLLGSGDPVVMIPGLFGSAFSFRKLVPQLAAAGYQAIVVEPLGIGASGKPDPADYSLTGQADRIAAALQSMGVRPALILAHSVGSSIALRIAYRHPERVAAVMCIEGGPTEEAGTPGFRRAMRFAPLLKLFGGFGHIRSVVRSRLIKGSADPQWVTEDVVDAYFDPAKRDPDGTLRAFRQMARAKEPELLQPHLGQIRCPVRLMMGTVPHDDSMDPEQIQILKSGLSNFGIEQVPAAGHFPFEENTPAVVAAVGRLEQAARTASVGSTQ